MLRNYINIAFRSLLKNKVFSFINIFGLAIGMAAFLFIIQYVRFERSYESYNPHADNLYRITIDFYNQGEYVVTDCETHAPMGPLIKDKLPEAQNFVRMFHYDGLVNLSGTRKQERVLVSILMLAEYLIPCPSGARAFVKGWCDLPA